MTIRFCPIDAVYFFFRKSGGHQLLWVLFFVLCALPVFAQTDVRQDVLLNAGWRTIANDSDRQAYAGFEKAVYQDKSWKKVEVPHNWDQYEGYRRLKHGNKHGYAWYRKTFNVPDINKAKQYFLFFEGVGSYATVWLNGKMIGQHDGGRTSFTLDITSHLAKGNNTLAVRADHPAFILDLPWVCGGCSEDRGFSEGSQPMGIFRPVHLIVTDPMRIEPFGLHAWNDNTISTQSALVHTTTEVKNYGAKSRSVVVVTKLLDAKNNVVTATKKRITVPVNTVLNITQDLPVVQHPHLWSLEDPYLYTVVSEIRENEKLIDKFSTPYGIRWISWPIGNTANTQQFLLNGKPVFINGTCEYEHQMGQSHAFSNEQIKARVQQIRSAGYNAFRDAHQPHNLLYQEYWDSLGVLWWPQFSAHIWYNTPEFKEKFKALLKDWVKERRNSPSVILWGLQNESKLPEDFARECTAIIRELDPTASSQRKVTTCNGGAGTDWDVPQNWTGTYGGDPTAYANDLQRQILVGEYGAWRSLDLHTEGPFQQNGILSEDRMTQLMEMKVRLAESVRDKCAGQFHWLFSSHENPGRTQGGEGYRELDRIGPVNYKGIFTPWGEPLDAYYMFRANYAPKDKEPMVYIVSHTWPDRWITAGKKDSIVVYSNCDEVELFNDVQSLSLGKRTRKGIGTHFQWDDVPISYNILYAEGKVGGKVVARDTIILHHLPAAPHYSNLIKANKNVTVPASGYQYLYRVNCGGPDYTDAQGNVWMADRNKKSASTWGSTSWTDDFAGMPPFFASQRYTNSPIRNTTDWPLFQQFRYGMDKLQYHFPVPDGDYWVELYFAEPWYGIGGGLNAAGWRLFDVAVNDKTVIKNLDIWKEVGVNAALKKTVNVRVTGGELVVSFPKVASGEAVIAAIAIASAHKNIQPAPASPLLIEHLEVADKSDAKNWSVQSWLQTGDHPYTDDQSTFSALPPALYGAEWIKMPQHLATTKNEPLATFAVTAPADVYIALDANTSGKPSWMNNYADAKRVVETDKDGGKRFVLYSKRFAKGETIYLGNNATNATGHLSMYAVFVTPVSTIEPAYDLKPTLKYEAEEAQLKGTSVAKQTFLNKTYVEYTQPHTILEWSINLGVADVYALRFRYINHTGKAIPMNMKVLAADGTVMNNEQLSFSPTGEKWATVDSSTGTYINAGNYKIVLTAMGAEGLGIDYLEVQ